MHLSLCARGLSASLLGILLMKRKPSFSTHASELNLLWVILKVKKFSHIFATVATCFYKIYLTFRTNCEVREVHQIWASTLTRPLSVKTDICSELIKTYGDYDDVETRNDNNEYFQTIDQARLFVKGKNQTSMWKNNSMNNSRRQYAASVTVVNFPAITENVAFKRVIIIPCSFSRSMHDWVLFTQIFIVLGCFIFQTTF